MIKTGQSIIYYSVAVEEWKTWHCRWRGQSLKESVE
jgi:hypothetical protein